LQFMEYLVTEEAQSLYARINYEFPVRPGVANSQIVASWGRFTADKADMTALAALRAQALQIMEEVDFDG